MAGRLIDAGNVFVNLDEARYVAMQRYTGDEMPTGRIERLRRPMRSVFSEPTWRVLDKLGEVAVGEVLPSVAGPVGSVLVGGAWVFREVRQERREDHKAFRRGDVDDLLDVARV